MSLGWQPTADQGARLARAHLYAQVRAFFAERKVLEVETPILARYGVSDVNLHSFRLDAAPATGYAGGPLYLQTSPEYAMKRLLASGSGCIYQISRVFREGERGPRHNPEFSMLEWYRVGFNDQQLMDEVEALLLRLLPQARFQRLSYRQLFIRILGLDPFTAALADLQQCAAAWLAQPLAKALPRDDLLDVCMTHAIEPALAAMGAVWVQDYPASQAALARTRWQEGHEVAHRFELYLDGLELCNGYWELTDSKEQQARFAANNQQRHAQGLPAVAQDACLLDALKAGMPDCAGVALGLDRLLMRMLNSQCIDAVLNFPIERA